MNEVVLSKENRGEWQALDDHLAVRVLADDDADVIRVRVANGEFECSFDRTWLAGNLGEWLPAYGVTWGPGPIEVTAYASDPIDTIRVRRA